MSRPADFAHNRSRARSGGFVHRGALMTWFSLPPVEAGQKAAFHDSRSASAWLAAQPQANAPAMITESQTQLAVFNTCRVPPDERFKTLTVLRPALFAISGECQRRYENKPLPLLPAEKALQESVRALWRACAISYLHCLRACLEGDMSISPHAAKVAHRALCCLRMEQLSCHLGGVSPDGEFWRTLHAVLVSAETLGVARDLVEDRLLGETKESTASGQYSMALLLELARPFSLSRTQLASVTRWLARWREQARVLVEPDTGPKACCVALDLSLDRPFHDHLRAPRLARWLSVGPVLRKISQRTEALAAGESPESLKLGTALSADACADLLSELGEHLRVPPVIVEVSVESSSVEVACGWENLYGVVGGTGLQEASVRPSSFGNQLSQAQLALFGHVVRHEEKVARTETWRVIKRQNDEILLRRPAGAGSARLSLRNLLIVRTDADSPPSLALVSALSMSDDGGLSVTARLFAGEPQPLLMEIREKVNGAVSRHPALMLPMADGMDSASLFFPSGLAARAASSRFLETGANSPLSIRLDRVIERGGDHERWRLAHGSA